MAACSAYGCTNRPQRKIPGITFHSFPKNEERRKQWVMAVRRKNWLPSKCSSLCSSHFPEEMIDRTSLSSVRLRAHAVPQIFDRIPSNLETEEKNPSKVTDKRKVKSKQNKNSSKVKSKQSKNPSKETVKTVSSTERIDEQFEDGKSDFSSKAISNLVYDKVDSEPVCNLSVETVFPTFREEMGSETDTNSDEENNSFTENAHGDSEEILKQKLEKLTALYKISQTRLKQCQRQCKLYMKENTSLKEVVNSLRQIIAVSDENCSEVKS